MRHLSLLALILLLAGCGTTSATPLTPAPTNRPPDPCPAQVMAASKPQPVMPAGVGSNALFGWLVDSLGEPRAQAWWKWFTETYPGWAREGWTRLDAARAQCPH